MWQRFLHDKFFRECNERRFTNRSLRTKPVTIVVSSGKAGLYGIPGQIANIFNKLLMRIMIAGPREDTSSALEMYLENRPNLEVVAKANDLQTTLNLVGETRPGIVLLDRNLTGQPLEELIQTLQQLDPQPGIILINSEPEFKQAALAAGAQAVVVKGDPPKSLLLAIETVRQKQRDDKQA